MYEYEYGPEIEFPQEFLEELSDYTCANNLSKMTALSTSSTLASTMEYELSTTATVTIHRAPQGNQENDSRMVGWSFRNVGKGDVDISEVINSDNYQPTKVSVFFIKCDQIQNKMNIFSNTYIFIISEQRFLLVSHHLQYIYIFIPYCGKPHHFPLFRSRPLHEVQGFT